MHHFCINCFEFTENKILHLEGKAESTPVSEEQKSHPLSAVVPTPLRDEEDESKRELDSNLITRPFCNEKKTQQSQSLNCNSSFSKRRETVGGDRVDDRQLRLQAVLLLSLCGRTTRARTGNG